MQAGELTGAETFMIAKETIRTPRLGVLKKRKRMLKTGRLSSGFLKDVSLYRTF